MRPTSSSRKIKETLLWVVRESRWLVLDRPFRLDQADFDGIVVSSTFGLWAVALIVLLVSILVA